MHFHIYGFRRSRIALVRCSDILDFWSVTILEHVVDHLGGFQDALLFAALDQVAAEYTGK